MTDDRTVLIDALRRAADVYSRHQDEKTILGASHSDPEVLEPIVAAIESCNVYQFVRGQVVFSANSGVILQASSLAIDALYRAQRNPEQAADWLIRVLGTRRANGLLKASIWGLSVDQDVKMSANSNLMPFDALPASRMKERIVQRSSKQWDGSAWLAPNYHDTPHAAYVMRLDDFPYIGKTTAPFLAFDKAVREAQEEWALLEGISVGEPIAVVLV